MKVFSLLNDADSALILQYNAYGFSMGTQNWYNRSVIHEIRFLVTCSFGAESILAYFHSENDQIFILWLKIPFGDPKNILQPYQRIVRSSLENHEKTQLFNDLPLQCPKDSKYVLLELLMTSERDYWYKKWVKHPNNVWNMFSDIKLLLENSNEH